MLNCKHIFTMITFSNTIHPVIATIEPHIIIVPTRTWTRAAGLKVRCRNHYTTMAHGWRISYLDEYSWDILNIHEISSQRLNETWLELLQTCTILTRNVEHRRPTYPSSWASFSEQRLPWIWMNSASTLLLRKMFCNWSSKYVRHWRTQQVGQQDCKTCKQFNWGCRTRT